MPDQDFTPGLEAAHRIRRENAAKDARISELEAALLDLATAWTAVPTLNQHCGAICRARELIATMKS